MNRLVKVLSLMVLMVSFTLPTYAKEALWEVLNEKVIKLYQQGQYSEAANTAKEALTVAKETFGSNHPKVAISLRNLALLYKAQGKYAEAETLYKRALKIYESALGKDHPSVATTLENMAGLYKEIGKKDEAEKLLKRAQKIRSRYQ